jgi:hypothetical protein
MTFVTTADPKQYTQYSTLVPIHHYKYMAILDLCFGLVYNSIGQSSNAMRDRTTDFVPVL